MPYRFGDLRRNNSSVTSPILCPSALQPTLVHVGLLAGAVAGAPETIPFPVLDNAHELTNNGSGAAASIKKLFTLLKRRRVSITNTHQVSLVCIAWISTSVVP